MLLLIILDTYNIYCSDACPINLGSSVILTGGVRSYTYVSEYTVTGWVRDLPELLQKRSHHACSYYDNDDGTKVDIAIDKFDPRILSWSLPWSVTHSVTQSQCWLPNERENILSSSVCESVGIKYSNQILQSCSKLGGSFRHSVSFQCLFKLRDF